MRLPSVLLHDHLDGGPRPTTLIELAGDVGWVLPTSEPSELARWFDQRDSGSLESYLAAFEHTIGVMQSHDALVRVAREAAEDLSTDGVVYAEIRFAPLLHTKGGLSPVEVVEAVLEGLAAGGAESGLRWGLILDAIRSHPGSEEIAELGVRFADQGVVAFDLAGPEAGFPPDDHLPAIRRIREVGLGLTLHAGEAAGVSSIAAAVNRCGVDRVGHGVEIIDDCRVVDGQISELGAVAARVRDHRVPLEVCPSSNLATKRWRPDQHPMGLLHRAGFNVTLNTDNRLMSATSMSQEWDLVGEHHGIDLDDRARITRQALEAAFCSEPVRRVLWEERIAPPLAEAGARVSLRW